MPNVLTTDIGQRARRNITEGIVPALNNAMAAHGILNRFQMAAFLAQGSVESSGFTRLTENTNYSSAAMMRAFPSHFPDIASTQPYVGDPEALFNFVYADVNRSSQAALGNTQPNDGYLYIGRGILQITGRDNYTNAGFGDNPTALSDPVNAADYSARFWRDHGLNQATSTELNRAQFDNVSRTVNGGTNAAAARWQAYQRALAAIP